MCSIVSTMWYDVVALKRRHGPTCWMATWLFAMLRAGALSWWVLADTHRMAPWNPASLPKDGLGFSVHGYPHLDVVPGVPVLKGVLAERYRPKTGWWSNKNNEFNTHDIQWHPMTSNDIQWHPMTSNDIQWHPIITMIIDQKPWPKMALFFVDAAGYLIFDPFGSHSSHSSQPRPSCCDHTLGHATYEVPKMTQTSCGWWWPGVLHCRSTSFRTKSVRSPAKNFLRSLRDIWHKHFLNSWSTEATKRPGQCPQSASELSLSSLDLSLGSLLRSRWPKPGSRSIKDGSK